MPQRSVSDAPSFLIYAKNIFKAIIAQSFLSIFLAPQKKGNDIR